MKLNDRSRPHFNPQQRAQLLKEFARNPGTAREFAAQHGIAASTLLPKGEQCQNAPSKLNQVRQILTGPPTTDQSS